MRACERACVPACVPVCVCLMKIPDENPLIPASEKRKTKRLKGFRLLTFTGRFLKRHGSDGVKMNANLV